MLHTLAGALLIGAHLILGGSDCQVTHAFEDGTYIADCADGRTWDYDADGQTTPYAPYREPGTWVAEDTTR
jgi:hypothetical protein